MLIGLNTAWCVVISESVIYAFPVLLQIKRFWERDGFQPKHKRFQITKPVTHIIFSLCNNGVNILLKLGGELYNLPHHDLRTILQRLRQVRGLNLFTPRQISDRARQFHALRAMIGARRQIELRHAQHDVAARIKR